MNITGVVVDQRANVHPDRIAIIAESDQITYKGLQRITNQFAFTLRQQGCGPGSRVLVSMSESPQAIAALFAIFKLGAIAVPVSPEATSDQYTVYLNDTGARYAILAKSALDNLSNAQSQEAIIVLDLASKDAEKFNCTATLDEFILETYNAASNEPALILYTSGSTAIQKPVVHCHGSVVAALRNIGQKMFDMQPSDLVLCSAKMFYAFGLGFGVYLPLGIGATTVLLSPSELGEQLRILASIRPDIICGVPSWLDSVLRASSSVSPLDLSSVRFVVSAGEYLTPHLFDAYQNRFGVEVLDGLGSTEMLTHFLSNCPGQARRGSCGTVAAGCEIVLVDDNGDPVADGEIGKLKVSGATAFLGYWRDYNSGTRRASNFVETGDRLYRDSEGFFYYCGRHDDMMKVSGLWIKPAEIESVLRSHPRIDECTVTAREDNRGRRRLVAYVVLNNGLSLNVSDLHRYMADYLAPYMVPTVFIELKKLPRTPNGKIARSALPTPEYLPV